MNKPETNTQQERLDQLEAQLNKPAWLKGFQWTLGAFAAFVVVGGGLYAAVSITSFTSGTTINAADVNANFSALKTAVDSFPSWAKGSNSADAAFTGGNVGIGTASPYAELSIKSASQQVYLETAANGNAKINFNENADQLDVMVNNSSGKIAFGTNSTERMRIDSAGNVGIGTTSPSQALHVAGSGSTILNDSTSWSYLRLKSPNTNGGYIQFADADDDDVGQIFYYHGSGGDYMSFTTNAAERMRIDYSGNVGIGTISPDAILHTAKTQAGGDVPIIFENSGI